MKKTLAFLAVCASFLFVFAQQIPDFKNQPMYLESDGSLKKLEKQTAEMKVKAKGFGYGGTSNYINLVPANSPVVIKGDKAEFVIKVEDDVDPETIYYLAKCTETNKNRQVEMFRTSAFAIYGAGGKSTKRNIIPLNYSKIAENVFKISVDGTLEPGEYAFVNSSQGSMGAGGGSMSIVYCFGVN